MRERERGGKEREGRREREREKEGGESEIMCPLSCCSLVMKTLGLVLNASVLKLEQRKE